MHGEAGNPEATRNVMLAEHGIASEPLAQAFGQNLRLFCSGFGHQHDELIATIARHHVRLARLLFEQSADTRQHEVALEVSHGVVDLFKFVEIDEHHRERPARNARPVSTPPTTIPRRICVS